MKPDCVSPFTQEECETASMVSEETLLDEFTKSKISGDDIPAIISAPKKKRRKRAKKGNTANGGVAKSKTSSNGSTATSGDVNANSQGGQNVLCISRNKHWKYISSYHVRTHPFSSLSYGQ